MFFKLKKQRGVNLEVGNVLEKEQSKDEFGSEEKEQPKDEFGLEEKQEVMVMELGVLRGIKVWFDEEVDD